MKKKILIAEDDPRVLNLYRLTLKEHFDLLEATNGKRALELAAAESPDLIVMDIVMPEMDGTEALRRLREAPATAMIPVILLTGKAPQKDLLVGYNRETDYYITKPFTSAELLEGVYQCLGKKDNPQARS